MAFKVQIAALVLLAVATSGLCRVAYDDGQGGMGRDLLQANKLTCNNNPGAACPACNFNTVAVKTLQPDGSTFVQLKSCLLASASRTSTISFISVSNCSSSCIKTSNVPFNSTVIGNVTIPAGKCFVEVCIYVHDGRYRRSAANPVSLENKCISSSNQRCALCDYKKVKITALVGTDCNDGNSTTCDDVCDATGTCSGSAAKCGTLSQGAVCGGRKGCGTCVQAQNGGCGVSNAPAVCLPYKTYIASQFNVTTCTGNDIANTGTGGQCAPTLLCCGFKKNNVYIADGLGLNATRCAAAPYGV